MRVSYMHVGGLDIVFGYGFVAGSVFRPDPEVIGDKLQEPLQGYTMVDSQVFVQRSDGAVFFRPAILHLGGSWLVGFPANDYSVHGNIQDSDVADDGRCCVRSCRGSRCRG